MSGCEKYVELMNRYLDGDLPAAQISDLLEHLETCASCRNRFDALKIMAFEMRHMQVEPPKALHGRIMQAVDRSDQRRPRAYLKTAAAVAACAAALALAVNGSFFQMADNYLFNIGEKSDQAEQIAEDQSPAPSGGGETNSDPAPADLALDAPESAPVQGEEDDAPAAFSSLPEAQADDWDSSDGKAEDPAQQDQFAHLSEEEGAPLESRQMEPQQEPQQAEVQLDEDLPAAGGGADQSQKNANLPRMDQGTRAAEVSEQPDLDPDQPLRIPPLDTDEVFAFYCVALGEGSIPNAFDQNEIVRFPDKNCMYIYVKTTQFTKKGCENLLSQSGFTIREGANLPETDESMPYGLIVIYLS